MNISSYIGVWQLAMQISLCIYAGAERFCLTLLGVTLFDIFLFLYDVMVQVDNESLYAEECMLDDCIRLGSMRFRMMQLHWFLLYHIMITLCSFSREKQQQLRALNEDENCRKYNISVLLFSAVFQETI